MPEDSSSSSTDAGQTDSQADNVQDGTRSTNDSGESSDWKARFDKLQADSRKWEERAKANATAARELDQLKKSQMTEQEKAVKEAEERGKSAATAAAAARLARAEFRAAAAGRVSKDTLDGFLDYADLAKFVGDDGEPDTKAIENVVKRLGGSQKTDFDGGARTSADRGTDMSALIREKAFGRR
jgi:hypothetical protein